MLNFTNGDKIAKFWNNGSGTFEGKIVSAKDTKNFVEYVVEIDGQEYKFLDYTGVEQSADIALQNFERLCAQCGIEEMHDDNFQKVQGKKVRFSIAENVTTSGSTVYNLQFLNPAAKIATGKKTTGKLQ